MQDIFSIFFLRKSCMCLYPSYETIGGRFVK